MSTLSTPSFKDLRQEIFQCRICTSQMPSDNELKIHDVAILVTIFFLEFYFKLLKGSAVVSHFLFEWFLSYSHELKQHVYIVL